MTPMHAQTASPPRRRCALLLVAVACLALLLAPTLASAKSQKQPRPLYWGAVIGSQLTGTAAPWDINAVRQFEGITGKGLSILSFSAPFTECATDACSFFPFPTVAMESLREEGIVPMMSWASQSIPSSLEEPAYQLRDVIAGDYDDYIRYFASQAAEWGHPFLLRLNPEMNGFWFPWSEGVNGNRPGEFVAAWRHIHHIFTAVGATNATWVWCPNVDFERRLNRMAGLYPGDKYVDWTCLDGFNWGDTALSAGWMSFDEIYRSTYKRVVKIAPHKPMLIGEVASDDRGGSKANWITNMLKVVPANYPKIRGLIWYDEPDQGMHWLLEGSSAKAFARGIRRKIYRPNAFANLPPGPVRPPGS